LCQISHPIGEGFGAATCPHGSRPTTGAIKLWLRHMPRDTEHATCQERDSVPPHAPRHRARHPPREGSGVTTCPEAPSPSRSRRGLRSHHVSHGSRLIPCAGRLWHRHVIEAPGPPPGRAPVSPRVLWLQTCLLLWEGSRAATCSVAHGPPGVTVHSQAA
jgi:hypothetical protein